MELLSQKELNNNSQETSKTKHKSTKSWENDIKSVKANQIYLYR